MNEKKIKHGLCTLYDALVHAMQWYIHPQLHGEDLGLDIRDSDDLADGADLWAILERSGVLCSEVFDYAGFERLMEEGLEGPEELEVDQISLNADLDTVLRRLGVLPFDETSLPEPDPDVF